MPAPRLSCAIHGTGRCRLAARGQSTKGRQCRSLCADAESSSNCRDGGSAVPRFESRRRGCGGEPETGGGRAGGGGGSAAMLFLGSLIFFIPLRTRGPLLAHLRTLAPSFSLLGPCLLCPLLRPSLLCPLLRALALQVAHCSPPPPAL